LAVKLMQHAARVLPGARSPWADAMRRELDYIGDDPAAVRWALGCIVASYRTRLTHRPSFTTRGFKTRAAWQQAAASGVLMVLIGLSLQENAGGQPAPPRPAVDETTCEVPRASPELPPRAGKIAEDFIERPARVPDSPCADWTIPFVPKEQRP
jgi:hypothetical protein